MPTPSERPQESGTRADNPDPALDPVLDRLTSGLLALVRHERQGDLNLRQLTVLALLVSTRSPHTIRALSAALDVAKPTISKAVNRLEAEGLATRLPDPADGRSVLVSATPRAAGLARRIGAAFAYGTA